MVIIAKLKIISRSGIVTKRSKEISRAPGHTGQHPSPCSAVHPPALPTAGFVLGVVGQRTAVSAPDSPRQTVLCSIDGHPVWFMVVLWISWISTRASEGSVM